MFDNASLTEILWSLASGLAMLIHLWLTGQAYLDWAVSREAERRGRARHWRGISAGWYLIGQFCLFAPKLIELAIGLWAMSAPNPQNEQVADAAALAQTGLILAEWVGVVGALSFWLARRALASWAEDHDSEHTGRKQW
jgi:hypothetical protein